MRIGGPLEKQYESTILYVYKAVRDQSSSLVQFACTFTRITNEIMECLMLNVRRNVYWEANAHFHCNSAFKAFWRTLYSHAKKKHTNQYTMYICIYYSMYLNAIMDSEQCLELFGRRISIKYIRETNKLKRLITIWMVDGIIECSIVP